MGGGNAKAVSHPQGKTMKAIGYPSYGTKDILQKVELPYPHGFDSSKNVVIKVRAISINPVDKYVLSGGMKQMKPVAAFPQVICYDAAGVIAEADGEGKFKVGEEVMTRIFGGPEDGKKVPYYRGAAAEFCVERTSNVVRKPSNISFEDAASIPLAGLTAYQAFKNMGLKEGDNVFITGGAGGVGTLAIQLAKHVFKAKVVGTTASAGAKEQLCKDLGADIVVDYKKDKFEEVYGAEGAEKFDVCFDTTGESLKMVQIARGKTGRIITVAGMPTLQSMYAMGMQSCVLKLFIKDQSTRPEWQAATAKGVDWKHLFLTPSGKDLQELADALKNGTIKPVLDNTWDFENDGQDGWKAAFDMQFSGRGKGKCVIRVKE